MVNAPPTQFSEAELSSALGRGNREDALHGLRKLRKADVHCHALLNCPLSTYEAVLGYKLPAAPPRFRDFGEFGGYLATNLFPATRTLDGMRALLRGGLERMADEGVVYAEASIDLLMPLHMKLEPSVVIDMVADERDRIAGRLCFAPEIGINRRIAPDTLWPVFVAYIDSGVFRAIDLYDDERAGDLLELRRFYRLAADRGLLLKAHAGETCGPEKIRETIDILEVDVIQHGIGAVFDPELLHALASKGTQLNVGVASNIALGVAGGYENHPVHKLLAAGVNVALGTDDFTVFQTGLCEEIWRLHRAGMPVRELAKLRIGAPATIPGWPPGTSNRIPPT
jgi:adenosine deaminase